MKRLALILALLLVSGICYATTNTTNYSFNKPEDNNSNWGGLIRANWDEADKVIKMVSEDIAGGLVGADKALDNLASVAINTSLVSDTDSTDDLGTSAKRWKKLFAVSADITNSVVTTVADSAVVKITQDHASSSEPALEIDNDGSGAAIEISDGDLSVEGDVYTVAYADYGATSTIVGWSTLETKQIYYKKIGKVVYIWYYLSGSVSDSTSLTFTVPYTSAGAPSSFTSSIPWSYDGGTIQAGPALAILPANSTDVTCYSTSNQAGWTASGAKIISGMFTYHTS